MIRKTHSSKLEGGELMSAYDNPPFKKGLVIAWSTYGECLGCGNVTRVLVADASGGTDDYKDAYVSLCDTCIKTIHENGGNMHHAKQYPSLYPNGGYDPR